MRSPPKVRCLSPFPPLPHHWGCIWSSECTDSEMKLGVRPDSKLQIHSPHRPPPPLPQTPKRRRLHRHRRRTRSWLHRLCKWDGCEAPTIPRSTFLHHFCRKQSTDNSQIDRSPRTPPSPPPRKKVVKLAASSLQRRWVRDPNQPSFHLPVPFLPKMVNRHQSQRSTALQADSKQHSAPLRRRFLEPPLPRVTPYTCLKIDRLRRWMARRCHAKHVV